MSDIVSLREPNLDWCAVDDEVVVLDLAKDRYLAVSASGAELWRMLVRGTTLEALAHTLVEGHGISAERARSDAEAFVNEIRSLGLLSEPHPGS